MIQMNEVWRRPARVFAAALLCIRLAPCWAGAASFQHNGLSWDEARVRICKLLRDPAMAGSTEGVVIEEAGTGRVLFELNPRTLLMPASNQKLLTSAAALAILGPDFRFGTRVVAAKAPDPDGVIRGDLFLEGSGDPFLNEGDLDELVQAVRKAGIRVIEGRVLADASVFTDGPYGEGWAWDDLSYAYSPQISGLNLNANVVLVECQSGRRAGARVAVRIRPDVGLMKVLNLARTGPAGAAETLSVRRMLGRNTVVVEGMLPAQAGRGRRAALRVTVEDPARFAAAVFARKLAEAGIAVRGAPGTGVAPPGAAEIAVHRSLPLAELLIQMNKPSDNLAAECLLRMAGKAALGEGSAAAGARAAVDWLARQGLDRSGLVIADGSGLSRQTLVTAGNLAALLCAVERQPWAAEFRASLPIAGVDGTLRNRMKGTRAAGNCRAKTGSLSGVSSLSGYVTSADGVPLAFVILMNHYTCPRSIPVQIQDGIVALLAQTRMKQAGSGEALRRAD